METRQASLPTLAVSLRSENYRTLVVGGGPAALQKTRSLLSSVANITVVAPQLHPEFSSLALASRHQDGIARIHLHERPYRTDDLDGKQLVLVATGDRALAEQIHQETHTRPGLLCCFADFPELGDVHLAATTQFKDYTIAVSSGGTDPAGSAKLRDQIAQLLTSVKD